MASSVKITPMISSSDESGISNITYVHGYDVSSYVNFLLNAIYKKKSDFLKLVKNNKTIIVPRNVLINSIIEVEHLENKNLHHKNENVITFNKNIKR